MKTPLRILLWKITRYLALILLCLAFVGTACVLFMLRPDISAQKAVAATRQLFRDQGFKTDVADFDFSTSPELCAREAILTNTIPSRNSNPFVNYPNLMEIVGNDSAIVVWKQVALKMEFTSWPDNREQLAWEDFREAISTNQAQVDSACAAVLSGPIGFNLNAKRGIGILLPHLSMLKSLMQTLGSRVVLDLHDGNPEATWTNLMTATRLVTEWEPEPTEVSHLVRFGNTRLAFNVLWQALQTNGWPDEKLARVQQEWEAVDFFKHLPETMAFQRASTVSRCLQERNPPPDDRFPLADYLKESVRHPLDVWPELKYIWNHYSYPKHGSFEDEKKLLLFYRDRELEFRKAVQAANWVEMRQLPGVTNNVFYLSKHSSRLQCLMNLKELSSAYQKGSVGFLGRAAEAEARRRILITALGLERYHGKHGAYPQTLGELSPEFLKAVPVDFMDGQPLRYRPTDGGHFILYSVGLDCVDNEGILQTQDQRLRLDRGEWIPPGMLPETDIVWPQSAGH